MQHVGFYSCCFAFMQTKTHSMWWLLNNLALRIYYTILGGDDFNIITRRALAHRVLQYSVEDVWWIMDNSHINCRAVCVHANSAAWPPSMNGSTSFMTSSFGGDISVLPSVRICPVFNPLRAHTQHISDCIRIKLLASPSTCRRCTSTRSRISPWPEICCWMP